jgi:hypothetical protein
MDRIQEVFDFLAVITFGGGVFCAAAVLGRIVYEMLGGDPE